MNTTFTRNRALYAQIIIVFGSLEAFADHLGVCRSYVSGVMNGKAYVSRKQKERFATALQCTVKDIFPEGDYEPVSA